MANHEDGQRQTGKGHRAMQRDVLIFLLARSPDKLTLVDLEAQLGDATGSKAAVKELIEVEILEREGDVVVPTLAARRGSQLLRLMGDRGRTESAR